MANSSLLPQEEDEVPSLGTTGQVVMEESPLERLISQSTPPPIQHVNNYHIPFSLEEQLAPRPVASTPHKSGFSMVTLVAGSLSLLHFAFVWGSILSNSWFDTYLRVTVLWQTKYLPVLSNLTDAKIQSTTLASILSTLNGAEQNAAFFVLLITGLLIPCLCMILCPMWTVGDHRERFAIRPHIQFMAPRIIFELLVRSSFAAFFVFVILDLGTSSIELEANDTDLVIFNRARGGLVAYTLGMFCALMVIMVLRMARGESDQFTADPLFSSSRTTTTDPRVPPAWAFQLPWQVNTNDRYYYAEESAQQTQPLLEDADLLEEIQTNLNMHIQPTCIQGLSYWQRVVVYEVGGMATLLWLPAMLLPLFEIEYEGLASEFMAQVSFQVSFWEIPAVLYQRGVVAGTDKWMLFVIGTVLVLTVYVLPLLATFLSVATWLNKNTRVFRKVLIWIHPTLCGIIFSLSLLFGVPAFEPLAAYLLDKESSGLCQRFQDVTDESCLILSGHHLLGAWFLLAQTVSLEVFVLLTIWWSKA